MIQANPTSSVVHALSFDIEDWFHMVEVKAVEDPTQWPQLPSLVEKYTRWVLECLERHNTKATFFMLGWVAERYPELIKEIAAGGHELALHSFWHRRVDELTADEFREDLQRNLDAVASPTGARVLGFRAPSFSVTPGAEWAFDVMHDLGLRYDASLFPAPRGHGGYPCKQEAHAFTDVPSGKPMPELPMSILKLGPAKLPFSGGGYMRLLPTWVLQHGFNRFEKEGIPVVVYLHPRDFAADCPRVPMPPHRKFKCYVGLGSCKAKLEALLAKRAFTTCEQVLADAGLLELAETR